MGFGLEERESAAAGLGKGFLETATQAGFGWRSVKLIGAGGTGPDSPSSLAGARGVERVATQETGLSESAGEKTTK